MSVVMITTDTYDSLRPSIEALLAQGPPEQLELIVTAPSRDTPLDTEALGRFGAWRVAEMDGAETTGEAMARGFQLARCPVVSYLEDHVLPAPGWAEARLGAHRAGAGAVAHAMTNGNPETAVSEASFLMHFGQAAAPVAGGPLRALPTHQISYRRELLPSDFRELAKLLDAEAILLERIAAAGEPLILEPGSVASHANAARARDAVIGWWRGGRIWGGSIRDEHASRPWLIIFRALAFPAVAGALLWRGVSALRRTRPPRALAVSGWLVVASMAHAAGHSYGLLAGGGSAARDKTDLELNRRHYAEP
jgi:hypothetical protein